MQACLFEKEEFSIFSRTSGGAICLLYLCSVIAACQNLKEKGLKYQ